MISDPYAAQSRRQRTGLIVGAVLAVLVLVLGSRQLGLSQGTRPRRRPSPLNPRPLLRPC
jgi:hypothetical protein